MEPPSITSRPTDIIYQVLGDRFDNAAGGIPGWVVVRGNRVSFRVRTSSEVCGELTDAGLGNATRDADQFNMDCRLHKADVASMRFKSKDTCS